MRSAVDSNIVSALWSVEPSAPAAARILGESRRAGSLIICAPVYAELLAHPLARPDFVEDFLSHTPISVEFDLDERIWREATRVFAAYHKRRRQSSGGTPKRLLVDFLVGAHAWLRADRLITLDPTRYQQAFPKLQLLGC